MLWLAQNLENPTNFLLLAGINLSFHLQDGICLTFVGGLTSLREVGSRGSTHRVQSAPVTFSCLLVQSEDRES